MIPKVIHYCWFGRNPKPEIIQKCIESWKQYCPDYEIIEWNEDNFDVNSISYTRDAYAAKKWAFVSDYARLWIVYNFGGVYLDTDVILKNSIDELLNYDWWLASDDVRYINTGMGFGGIKGDPLLEKMMLNYSNLVYPCGTNVIIDTVVVEQELKGWRKSNYSQIIGDGYIVGMNDYGKYAKHLYTYSWGSEEEIKKRKIDLSKNGLKGYRLLIWKIKCMIRNPKIIVFFDKRKGSFLEMCYSLFAYDFLDYGPVYYVKLLFNKLFKRK